LHVALRRALQTRQPSEPMLHHANRDAVESFFATLEMELIAESNWTTRRQAIPSAIEYLDGFYNQVRRHDDRLAEPDRLRATPREGGAADRGLHPEPPRKIDRSQGRGAGEKAA
jgi:hypothetical protein